MLTKREKAEEIRKVRRFVRIAEAQINAMGTRPNRASGSLFLSLWCRRDPRWLTPTAILVYFLLRPPTPSVDRPGRPAYNSEAFRL